MKKKFDKKTMLEWGVEEKLRLFILMSSIISFNQERNYLLRIKLARLRDNFKDSKKNICHGNSQGMDGKITSLKIQGSAEFRRYAFLTDI